MSGSRGSRDEAGETLVEVLVTVVILGLAGVAILAGVELSVKSSTIGRNEATGGSYVRSLAEVIQENVAAGGYATCGGYVTDSAKSRAGIPSTYTATQSSAQVWNGSSWTNCTNSTDNGIQRMTITVATPDTDVHKATEQLTMIVRRPCSGTAGASACA